MAQVFSRTSNVLAKASIVFGVLGVAAISAIGYALYTSPAVNQVKIARMQPIPFSHQRHVGGNGIDCRYCHSSVESSNFAGIPPTETCMTCHSQVLIDAPMLQPVHQSWKTNKPMEWARIYDLPDFVYFDHSIHVAKGVGCTTCHGAIDEQPLTFKANTLFMGWCLQCHKAPEKFVRPKDKVFDVAWQAPADQIEQGRKLVEEYGIKVDELTNCSICHR
ncbi:MAG: cytochrome c3 family protein [Candidatus Hydrogenedentes bacterium]|nr:cytochrome c3 family protein [Candidatus Hydrogenedentota bacterium]